MPKFTLIAEHTDLYGKPTSHKVTHEFNVDTLDQVLENFDLFIRGCGFFPPQGATLDYIEDDFPDWVGQEDQEWHNEEFVTPTEAHSQHYFDSERNK